jgi:capsular exopolysaccharide synthesis family protein
MLHSTPRPGLPREREDVFLHSEPDYISFVDISRFLRRSSVRIGGFLALALGVAALYVATAQPTYTARTQILIDPAAADLTRDPSANQGRSLDTAQVEGQMAVLRSENLAFSVIGRLKLMDDPEFQAWPPSPVKQLIGFVKTVASGLAKTFTGLGDSGRVAPRAVVSESARQRTAVDILQSNVDVRRVGTSYAIDITYTSPDPEKAAIVANAVAESYIDDQRKSMSRAAQQSSDWLETRLSQLRSQLNTAARQLELFRAGRDIRGLDQRRDVTTQDTPPAAQRQGGTDMVIRDKSGVVTAQRDTGTRNPVTPPPGEITLAELESTTESYRKIYEAYQQAFTEAVQRQSFPVTNTRVITAATKPLGKGAPRTQLIMIFGALTGLLFGIGAAALREGLDSTVRTARQIRSKVGLPCLAVVPRIDKQAMIASSAEAARLRVAQGARAAPPIKGPYLADYNFRFAIDVPFSPFSSAMKNLRTAVAHADPRNPMRCIGVTSSMPREGKSMISGNLATLYALSAGRTLIIDADIHNSTLSRHYAPGATIGLLEVIAGLAELDRAIVKGSGFVPDILPIAVKEAAPVSYEQLASEKMQTLLHALRERYDMVIMDLPPVNPIVDSVAIAALLDGVVLVAECGRTPIDLVAEVRSILYTAQANVLGVVITKADASTATVRWRKDWGYGYYPTRSGIRAPIIKG